MQKMYTIILIFTISVMNCLYGGQGFLAARTLTKQQLKNFARKGYNLTNKFKEVALKPGEISINVASKLEGKLQSLAKGKSLRADVYVEVGDDVARTIKGAKIERVDDGGYLITPPIKKEAIKTIQYRYKVSPEGVALAEPFTVEKKLFERVKDTVKSLSKKNREKIVQEKYLAKAPTIKVNPEMFPVKKGDTISGKFKVVLSGQPEAIMHGTIINTGEGLVFIEYAGKEGLFAKAGKMVKGADGRTVPSYMIMESAPGVYSLGLLGKYTIEGSKGLRGIVDDLAKKAGQAAEKAKLKLEKTAGSLKPSSKKIDQRFMGQELQEGADSVRKMEQIELPSAPQLPQQTTISVNKSQGLASTTSADSGSLSLYPEISSLYP